MSLSDTDLSSKYNFSGVNSLQEMKTINIGH